MKRRLLFILNGSIMLLCGAPAHAQSIWNNAGTSSWFTPGNWTPSGVPDATVNAQINNGGTAQITTAGAAAKTLTLGNGVGEAGTVSVSGAGALTISSAGFFLTVGEAGTGTLNVSAGGTVVNAPVLYIGDMTGSGGTVTVTGAGSSITAQFDVEVGRSGTGTLNILDGASFFATGAAFNVGNGTGAGHVKVDGTTANTSTLTISSINIGGGTLGSTADVTVTGANAKLHASSTIDVGSAGNGTLTMSVWAKGNASALLIGDAGTGTVTLTDTGTALTVTTGTGKVTVGNTTPANLNIQAGATLTSLTGIVGQNPGAAGTVTITGTGSQWTTSITNGFLTGQSGVPGGTATINVLNGGKLSASNLNAYTDTTIKVDGTGSQMSLPNDSGATLNKSLFLGSVGTNKLDVTNGGTLTTGSSILTTTAGTSLTINIAGPGSNWTATPLVGTLTTQFGGAGTASFTVDDHATFTYGQNGIFNVDTTGAGTASLTVKNGATFDVGTTSTILRIAQDGTGSLTINSGGTVNTAHAYIGEDAGAVGTATVSGVGTIFNANDLQVGTIGGQGTMTVSSGAFLFGDAVIGGTGGSGTLTVTDAGTKWTIASGPTNAFVFVENNGSLKILAGASVGGGSLSAGTGGTNGTILIDGNGTQTTGTTLFTDGTGTITIQNKAVVAGFTAVLGQNEGAVTTVTVDGAGTQWNMTSNPEVGGHGSATLNIQNGAHVTSNQFYLGFDKNTDNTGANGIVNVTGTGSSLAAAAFLRVADFNFTSGTLTISLGGTVTSVSGGTASTSSGIASTNNSTGSIVVTGANSSWTNTGDVYVGKGGTGGIGTLTVASAGNVNITGAVSINATSTLNIGTGGTAGTFSAASVANSGLIHFNLTDSTTYSAPTSGAGTVTKDGAGTVIVTGTHTYTGATTINGGVFRVNGSLGTTAVTVNTGATLGGSGTIAGAVTIANGGILAPGNSPGTITLGTLTLNSGSIENYELGTPNSPGGATNDLTEVNGNLTLDGTLNVVNGAGFGAGVYRLFDYTGTLTNNTLDLGTLPAGFSYTIDTSIANQVNLDVAAGTFDYWNGSHTTPNGTVNGGTGTWNNSTTNWTNSTGTTSGAWVSGGIAHFTGAAGTVTLGDNITAAEIQFLAGSGAYTITVPTNLTLTITGAGITNTSGLTQNFSIPAASLGGIISFNNNATAGTQTAFTTGGANVNGANGGIINFNDTSTAGSAAITNDPGTVSGAKGGATHFNNSSTAGNGTFSNNGAAVSGALEGQINFFDTSTAGTAHFTNNGAAVSGGIGGRTEITNTATGGSATFTNNGGTVSGAGGGFTEFFTTSPTGAGTATFINNGATVVGAPGGSTIFHTTTTAGSGTFTNNDGAVGNAVGGTTSFLDNSTAANATINNVGAHIGQGGTTTFANSSTAGAATINDLAATRDTELAGTTTFSDTTNAGTAAITNTGSAIVDTHGGELLFQNNAQAASAHITNNGSTLAAGLTDGGHTRFNDSSGAATAIIVNNGGLFANSAGGQTFINGTATAASATITNNGGAVVGAFTGDTQFTASGTAGTATITNNGGATDFFNSSNAGTAHITNNFLAVGASGFSGGTAFDNNASALNATILNNGSTIGGAGNSTLTTFSDNSTAAAAHITNAGGTVSDADGGLTIFFETVTNNVSTGTPTAANATIDNQGSSVAGARGGLTEFSGTQTAVSAANSTITNDAATTTGGATGGGTTFFGIATGGSSTITSFGSTVSGAAGGLTQFQDASTAGSATLVASGGTGGGLGGQILFKNTATGGTANATVNGNGKFDISGLTNSGMSIGTIAGSGNFFLGSKQLTVGGTNGTMAVSGVIADGGASGGVGGSLTKAGTGNLTLTGASTYTGATTVNGGTLFVNGSLGTTAVTVNTGATLGGSGTIGGTVTIANGGTLAPGNSPGTITMGTLTLNSGSIENYDLNTPNVVGGGVNDLTVVTGNLTLDGTLNVAAGGAFGAGVYRLFNYTGTLTNNILDIGTLPGGFNYTIDLSTANQVNLDVSVIGATFTYWNGSHTTPNGTVNGGTGTWNNVTTNWTDVAGSASGAWTNGAVAHFTGAPGTVTLGDNISASEIQFLSGSGAYTITAPGGFALTINGAGVTNSSGIVQHFIADVTGATGGQIVFNNSALAGDGNTDYTTIGNAITNSAGGQIIFNGTSRAGTATFTNNGGGAGVAGTHPYGSLLFHDNSSADHAIINNNGGVLEGGETVFDGNSTADHATLIANTESVVGFIGNSTAANATITVNGAVGPDTHGGDLSTADNATLGNALINNNGSNLSGGLGGEMEIAGSLGFGNATINNNGGLISGGNGGNIFLLGVTAGTAHVTNGTGAVSGANPGTIVIDAGSGANATFTNVGGSFSGNAGGSLGFGTGSTLASVTIENQGATASGAFGGTTGIGDTSTAASASITNDGATASGATGGSTTFSGTATAAGATLTNNAGTVAGAGGGSTQFTATSTAGAATLTANGGAGTGGNIQFLGDSTGGTATAILHGNGFLDISQHNAPGVSLGSIEGDGNVFLGARNLTVTTGLNKLFSGVLQDGGIVAGVGGSFTKNGTGNLNLTGASTYTSATTINGGTLFVNGSLGNTAVAVNSGGTLGGTGHITGSVTLNSGGTLAPGNSPGTIFTGALVVNAGSNLNYELATPGVVGGGVNDLTEVTGNLTLSGGTLNITGLAGFGIGTYRIIDYTGTLLGSTLNIGTAPLGYLYTVDTSVPLEVNLVVAGGGPLPIAYWNGTTLVPNGRVNGGPGTWDNSSTNWTDADGNLFGSWGGQVAIFEGAPGTINLGSNVNFTSLEFVTDGHVIHGGVFSLTGVGPVVIITDPGIGATIDATIFAPGGVTKLGAGSLFLDGSLFGNLQVLQGLLGGHGSILGNLFNAAIVSPGHSPGTLHVSGNYTQTSTALLKIEIGGRGISEHDLLTVGGTADLNGTLQLVRLDKFKLKRHQPVTFLTAGEGVRGEFAHVISDFTSETILRPTVIYHQNSVALEAVQGLFADLDGLTFNQKAVARALDSAASDRRADAIFDYLDSRKLNKLPGDFDKIAPEELTSIFTIGVSLANVQSQNIQRRTDDIRSGSSGFNAANLAVNGDGPSYSGSFRTGAAGPNGVEIRDEGKEGSRDSGIPQSGKTKEIVPTESRWGTFLSGTGEWVSVGNTDNARGYDLSSGGFTLGVDYKFTPTFALGLMAGYTGTTADLVDRGRVYVNGGKIGLYATYFQNEQAAQVPTMSKDFSKEAPTPAPSIAKGFYADMAVTGGYNSYDTRRSALQGEARGDTDGGELNALFGAGYDFKKGGLTFGPTASFNYTYLGTNDFTEHGSLAPLNIHGGKGESLRTAFGIKASYDWKVGGVLIKPEIRAAWQHEYGDAAYALDSGFANGAGGTFTVNGPQLGRDSALLGAGFAIQCSERFSTYFYYDGELGRKNYQSTSVTGGFRYAF